MRIVERYIREDAPEQVKRDILLCVCSFQHHPRSAHPAKGRLFEKLFWPPVRERALVVENVPRTYRAGGV